MARTTHLYRSHETNCDVLPNLSAFKDRTIKLVIWQESTTDTGAKTGDDFYVICHYPGNPKRLDCYTWSGELWYKSGFTENALMNIVLDLSDELEHCY
jgi:hypothetical protein